MVLTKDFMWFYQQQMTAARKAQEEGKTPEEIEAMHAEAKKNGVDVSVDYSTFNRAQRREMEKAMKRKDKKNKKNNAEPPDEVLEQLNASNEDIDEIKNEIMEGTVE